MEQENIPVTKTFRQKKKYKICLVRIKKEGLKRTNRDGQNEHQVKMKLRRIPTPEQKRQPTKKKQTIKMNKDLEIKNKN